MTDPSPATDYHIQPYHMNGLNWRVVPDGAEKGNITVVTGFMPAWWQAEYGITFGSPFHLDPKVHQQTLVRMNAALQERFADLPGFVFGDDYENTYPCERRYGDAFIPALFGDPVDFDDASGHPFAALMNLSEDQVRALAVPDVANHPVVKSICDPDKGGYQSTSGHIGNEGVINIAYVLRGENMFVDIIQRPDLFDHLCHVVFETIASVMHTMRTWQDSPGPDHIVVCDCVINMLSPAAYRERLYRYERMFADSFELFGIHTCNWTVDPYLDIIAEISDRINYLDMGPDSDLDKVHRLFPDLKPSVFYHPENVRNFSIEQITRQIDELCRRIGRGYILLSDLEAGTPDSHIRAVYDVAARF